MPEVNLTDSKKGNAKQAVSNINTFTKNANIFLYMKRYFKNVQNHTLQKCTHAYKSSQKKPGSGLTLDHFSLDKIDIFFPVAT